MNMRYGVLGALAFVAVFSRSSVSSAAYVTRTVQNGSQLAKAFADANANPGDFYDVTLKPTLYHLSSTLQLTAGNMRLMGLGHPGDTVITGDNSKRILTINPSPGAFPQLDVMRITIADGFTEGSGGGVQVLGGWCRFQWSNIENNRSTLPGAGIAVQNASLVLWKTSLIANYGNNLVQGGGVVATGGGVYLGNGAVGTFDNSSIVRNSNIRGAGVALEGNAQLTMTNTTVSDNRASAKGAGIYLSGTARLVSQFNTITANVAGDRSQIGEAAYGGGLAIRNYTGSFTMVGTIIADNTTRITNSIPGGAGNDCYEDLDYPSSFTPSVHGNMIGKLDNCTQLASPTWPNIGSSSAVHANLGPLVFNPSANGEYHGPTRMPLSNSAAIGAYSRYWWNGGSSTLPCPTFDARGFYRGGGNTCDIGAIDYTANH